jgi:predicted DNA-binding transcriptional regulator AlpA
VNTLPTHRQTLRLAEVADVLGYSVSTCRRLVASGDLPGPIDPDLAPKLRRWSRPLIERYADPTPAPAIEPLRIVHSAVAS